MTPNCTPSIAPATKPRALVIDDDPLFRTLLVSMLKQEYTVTAAADGAEGFYKALECPPAIAVIDIQMPVWDGLRTIRAFREHESLRDMRLLVLSSDTSQETVLAALVAGADEYLSKTTLSHAELLQKLAGVREKSPSKYSTMPLAAASCWASRGEDPPWADDPLAGNESQGAVSWNERLQEQIDAWD
jgi:CheY-like chemotaxis protein